MLGIAQCINVNRLFRTKALVLELLAAVCLVRGGHDIILAAFDNFKEVSRVIAVADSHFMYFSGVSLVAATLRDPCFLCEH